MCSPSTPAAGAAAADRGRQLHHQGGVAAGHTAAGDISMLLMSSVGHTYFQQLSDESRARHGTFYVTNIMELPHPDIKDSGGSLAGGGVSIYYSHTLQMLFCSYAQGRAFMAPLTEVTETLPTVFSIQVRDIQKFSKKILLSNCIIFSCEVAAAPARTPALACCAGGARCPATPASCPASSSPPATP